jgi:hypothetical protein
MITSLLDFIAGGLGLLYGRPLGHDAATVFLIAFGLTLLLSSRRWMWMSPPPSAVGGTGPLGIAAAILRWGIYLVPLVVGLHFLAQEDIARSLIYTALAIVWIHAFAPFLPLWIAVGWYGYGLWPSLLGNGLMFVALSVPGWLLTHAPRAHGAGGGRPGAGRGDRP